MTLTNTVDALLDRVRRDALLTLRGPVFTLSASYLAGATQLFLNEDPTNIGPGSIVAVDAELFYVKQVDSASKVLTVIPGYLGSTQANHADDAFVEVDPRVPKASLLDFAQQEISSWGSQLFRVVDKTIAFNRQERTYELPDATSLHFLLDVRQQPLRDATEFDDADWFRNTSWIGDSWPKLEAKLLRDMPTTKFASGFAVQLMKFPEHDSDGRVVYAAPFDLSTFTTATDLVSTIGLLPEWLDVLEFGVRWRALSSGLVARTDWRAAGMSRNAEEVNTLDIIRATDMARSMRDGRLANESLELRKSYPYSRRT